MPSTSDNHEHNEEKANARRRKRGHHGSGILYRRSIGVADSAKQAEGACVSCLPSRVFATQPANRLVRYEQILALHRQGLSMRATEQQLHVSRQVVHRSVTAGPACLSHRTGYVVRNDGQLTMPLTNLVASSTFILCQAISKPIEIARFPAAITWSSAPSI